MMKHATGLWALMGFAVTAFVGTGLHFLYGLTGEAGWIAPFSGVNESTWEHMKLLFWPMLLFAVLQRCFVGQTTGYWCIKLRGILLGLVLIPVLFYTWNGAIGPSPDWVNIGIFFVSAAAAYRCEARQFSRGWAGCCSARAAGAALFGLAVLFVLFTFVPPALGLFRDPLTGGFGR